MKTAKRAEFYGMILLGVLVSSCPLCVWASEEESERLYSQGLVSFHEKQYGDALALFQRAAAEEPPYYLAIYYLGVTYGKLGQYAKAVPLLEKALELMERTPTPRPGFISAHLDLAVAYSRLGHYKDALLTLEKAERVDPQNNRLIYDERGIEVNFYQRYYQRLIPSEYQRR